MCSKGCDDLKNIKVKEAAEILGVSEQFVRIGLQRGLLPIGTAVKMSSIWTYHISPKLLDEYVGSFEGNREQKEESNNCVVNELREEIKHYREAIEDVIQYSYELGRFDNKFIHLMNIRDKLKNALKGGD